MHSHTHGHHHHHHHSGKGSRLWLVFALNFSFTIIEFIGGYFTNSFAITSDAFHDLGDSLALFGAILLERYAHKRRNDNYSYGYRRFSLLSAMLISSILMISSVFIIYQAVQQLSNPPELHTTGMIWLALAGVLVNGSAALQLFKKGQGLNEKAIRLHLLEDTMGWLAVLVGALVIWLTGFTVIDPILSLIIALWILVNAVKGIKNVLQIMLQASPLEVDTERIKESLRIIKGVDSVNDLHIWSLDGERNISTVHVSIDKEMNLSEAMNVKEKIRESMQSMGSGHTTVEIDLENADCEFGDCD